jgi:hypothetical protein
MAFAKLLFNSRGNEVRQAMVSTMPPSARSAAPLVADASFELT